MPLNQNRGGGIALPILGLTFIAFLRWLEINHRDREDKDGLDICS